MEVFNSLEESSLWVKDVSEKTENEAKEQMDGFLSMSLGVRY